MAAGTYIHRVQFSSTFTAGTVEIPTVPVQYRFPPPLPSPPSLQPPPLSPAPPPPSSLPSPTQTYIVEINKDLKGT